MSLARAGRARRRPENLYQPVRRTLVATPNEERESRIVGLLACFTDTSAIAEFVQTDFGITDVRR